MNDLFSIVSLVALSLGFTLVSVLVFFYAERKGSAFIQDRLGPTHVGKFGLLQPFADLLKLAQKETIVPTNARKYLFFLAPVLVFASVFAGFALLPLWADIITISQPNGGILLLLGLLSIEAAGIIMAGYASQSKFPWLAMGRGLAQMLSYEVPLGIAVLTFIWIANSADLAQIQAQQLEISIPTMLHWPWNLLGFQPETLGGFFSWNVIRYPVLIFLLPGFYLSILAESNRAPFDIPEGESEIIGGFHTEYSGFLWAVFFLAEYGMMLILSLLLCYLFLGGTSSPIPHIPYLPWLSLPGLGWLVAKSWLICLSMIWIRWTLPRLRVDQLMGLSWKVLTPISLLVFFLTLLLK